MQNTKCILYEQIVHLKFPKNLKKSIEVILETDTSRTVWNSIHGHVTIPQLRFLPISIFAVAEAVRSTSVGNKECLHVFV